MNKPLMVACAALVAFSLSLAVAVPVQSSVQAKAKPLTTRQLTAAQGEMRTQVEDLRAKVTKLEQTVTKLEARVAQLDSPHPKLIPLAQP